MSIVEKIPSSVKKILFIIGLLILSGVTKVGVKEFNDYYFKPKTLVINDENLQSFIDELNKKLPYFIGSNMRMDSVELKNKTVTNKVIVLNVSTYQEVVGFRDNFDDGKKREIIKINCSNTQLKEILNINLPIVYDYLTPEGRTITKFEITKKDCN